MPQLLLPTMPEGATRINATVSRLEKEGRVTWWVGQDNYFSHPAAEPDGQRLAVAILMANGHARPGELGAAPGISPRSLVRWRRQLEVRGSGSFYSPRAVRGEGVLTREKAADCERLLATGLTIAAVARQADIKESTLRKAVAAGRVAKPAAADATAAPRTASLPADATAAPPTKSRRSQGDAAAAAGIGTACTRADERVAATCGLARSAATRFEPGHDILPGGVLCGLSRPPRQRPVQRPGAPPPPARRLLGTRSKPKYPFCLVLKRDPASPPSVIYLW